MSDSNKFNQRFHQIRGLRHILKYSVPDILPNLLGQLNFSLNQYDNQFDEQVGILSQSKRFPEKGDYSLDRIDTKQNKKQNLLDESVADPYQVIDQTKKARFQARKGSANLDYLPKVLSQMVQERSLSLPKKSKNTKFNKVRKGINNSPRNIQTKEQRMDPFAEPAILQEKQLNELGMLNILNMGIIPKDIDISRAFDIGQPLIQNKVAEIHNFSSKRLRQYTMRQSQGSVKLSNPILNQIQKFKKPINTAQSNSQNSQIQNIFLKELEKEIVNDEGKKIQYCFLRTKNQFGLNFQFSQPLSDEKLVNNFSQISSSDEISQKQLVRIFQSHQLTFKKFELVRSDQIFIHYKNFNLAVWGPTEHIILKLEILFVENNIQMAKVNGRMLLDLAQESKLKFIKKQQLVSLIVELQVREILLKKIRGNQIFCVVKIQSFIRQFIDRKAYKSNLLLEQMAVKIQRFIRRGNKRVLLLTLIKQAQINRHNIWLQNSTRFKEQWETIYQNKRVEVHIVSFDVYDLKEIQHNGCLQMLNSQLGRLFRVSDPMVEVIYICGIEVQEEIRNYYFKILELGSVSKSRMVVSFISPQISGYKSVPQELIISSNYRKLRSAILNKEAFIIPGAEWHYTQKLAEWLAIPIYGSQPQDYRQILPLVDVPISPGSGILSNFKELVKSLTLLILHNPEIHVWLFKCKKEHSGLGIAELRLSDLNQVNAIVSKIPIQINDQTIKTVHQQLESVLMKVLRIQDSCQHSNVYQYLEFFFREGGFVEAFPPCRLDQVQFPSISFIIQPNGILEIFSSFDKLQVKPYCNYACSFPQKSIDSLDILQLSKSVAQALGKNYQGFVTIDLVTFPSPIQEGETLFWIVEYYLMIKRSLDCYLNTFSSIYMYFHFLMEGEFNQNSGVYSCKVYDQPLISNPSMNLITQNKSFFYVPFLFHQNLINVSIRSFFQLCRVEGMSFDLEQKQGATYILLDQIENGSLGLVIITNNKQNCLKLATSAIIFILKYNCQDSLNLAVNQQKMGQEIQDFTKILKEILQQRN